MIYIWIGLNRLDHSTQESSTQTVSVIVAARNEADNIHLTLNALSQQIYPSPYSEFILVDDNSTDNTLDISTKFINLIPNSKIIKAETPTQGVSPKKSALSKGISESINEIILLTDADCEPSKFWIQGIVNEFEPDVSAVVGFSPLTGTGIIGSICRLDSLVNAAVAAGTIGMSNPVTSTGRNFAYRKSVWDSLGGFGDLNSAASGDDDLLLQKISSYNGKVRFCLNPETFVKSKGKQSLQAWWNMKRRHISAGKRYKPMFVIVSSVLYFSQLFIIIALSLSIAGVLSPFSIILIWGAKVFFDWITLHKAAYLLKVKNWLLSFLIAEVITPFLFTVLVPAALFRKIGWKGRKLSS